MEFVCVNLEAFLYSLINLLSQIVPILYVSLIREKISIGTGTTTHKLAIHAMHIYTSLLFFQPSQYRAKHTFFFSKDEILKCVCENHLK